MLKSKIRKKILRLRKKNNNQYIKINFNKIYKLLKKKDLKKKIVGGYYPVNSEIDDLHILKELEKKKLKSHYLQLRKILKWILLNVH